MFENPFQYRMFVSQHFQNICRRGIKSCCCFAAPIGWFEAQVIEKHIRKLLRRVDIKCLACQLKNFLLEFRQTQCQIHRHFAEELGIDQGARHFHIGEHSRERHVYFRKQFCAIYSFQFFLHNGHETQGGFCVCGGIRRNRFNGNFSHGDLFFSFADQFFNVSHLFTETISGKIL